MTETTQERRQILVVDDDPSVRMVVSRVLEGAGFEVCAFERSRDALAHLLDHPVDVMVVDQNLPSMSGLELVRKVRAERGHVPVVLISGLPNLGAMARERIEVFLAKPFNSLKALEHGVLRALELAKSEGARDELQRRLVQVVCPLANREGRELKP